MRIQKTKRAFLEAKQDLSPRTLEHYSRALDHLERECPKMPKKPEPIRQALNKAHTIWVKVAWWSVWSAFFHWCHRQYGTPNPMERVDRPKPPDVEMKTLEPEELTLVVATTANLRDKAIVSLALDAGIRANEFGRLRILDIRTNTIRVWGKGNKRVRIPISPEAHYLLQLLISQDGSGGPQTLLFPSHDGQPISRFAIYRIVRHCMERAGIHGPKLGSHCLRHSLATNFLANGGDLSTLQIIMRHRNIATTMKYVHLSMPTIVKQHHQYSPLREAIRDAQGFQQGFFHKAKSVEEAEEILERSSQ